MTVTRVILSVHKGHFSCCFPAEEPCLDTWQGGALGTQSRRAGLGVAPGLISRWRPGPGSGAEAPSPGPTMLCRAAGCACQDKGTVTPALCPSCPRVDSSWGVCAQEPEVINKALQAALCPRLTPASTRDSAVWEQ